MNAIRCHRCNGHLRREDIFDLPRRLAEYYCMDCGERFWIDLARYEWKLSLN